MCSFVFLLVICVIHKFEEVYVAVVDNEGYADYIDCPVPWGRFVVCPVGCGGCIDCADSFLWAGAYIVGIDATSRYIFF